MEAMHALVLTDAQLRELLTEAARQGAAYAVEELRAELRQSPDDATLAELRAYIADPATQPDPHGKWAHSGIIRHIQLTARGKPKSTAWFMRFQRETGLGQCHTRQSAGHGKRREWTFADIKLAWDAHYGRR
jgi:hypothetical protein